MLSVVGIAIWCSSENEQQQDGVCGTDSKKLQSMAMQ